jgi:hypothetical protein
MDNAPGIDQESRSHQKELVIHNPNVFNVPVQVCRVGMQFFAVFSKKREEV